MGRVLGAEVRAQVRAGDKGQSLLYETSDFQMGDFCGLGSQSPLFRVWWR